MSAQIIPIREVVTVDELKQRLRVAIDNSRRPPLLNVLPDGTIVEIDADARFRSVVNRIAELMDDHAAHGGEAHERAHRLVLDFYREWAINA